MNDIKEAILDCLQNLKGKGTFISKGVEKFVFPGLEIKGLGEITYPINTIQAKALIQVAQKAPFGKGRETIIDNRVRSGWEIDADKLIFNGNNWTVLLDSILGSVKQDLGLEDYKIKAHLYKLLLYEEGDFFLPHKDSEKQKGMFGTLVVGLPSRYEGGELIVSFEGVNEVADFAQSDGEYKINYTAFFADCDHEVKPLRSGYRICLVYNLVQQNHGKQIEITTIASHAETLAKIFKNQRLIGNLRPHIILLGHQYTPENFSADSLKLNDRSKAEALLRAAQQAGCYAKLCLVTSYKCGEPDFDGGGYYDYDDDMEDGEIAEVIDESLSIEYWVENDIPSLSDVNFEQDELITAFALDEDEPIVKESTGFMGNYGPDLMHWYHYGAVMVWSPEANGQLLPLQDTESKLKWIDYFNKDIERGSESEISAIENMLASGIENNKPDKKSNYNVIVDWVINRKDDAFFLKQSPLTCKSYFINIDGNHWLKLIDFLPREVTERIFSIVTDQASVVVVEHLLVVLRTLLATGRFAEMVSEYIKKLDLYLDTINLNATKKEFRITPNAFGNLLWIEKQMPQDQTWVDRMCEALTVDSERNYIHGVLVPQLLGLKETTKFAEKLLLICRQYLQQRADHQPQPPVNWSRPLPAAIANSTQWQPIKAFLESPDEMVFDYRKRQDERDTLEHVIRHGSMDLKTETIKRGSPHTLRITKTRAAYHKAMRIWEEDGNLLEIIMQKTQE